MKTKLNYANFCNIKLYDFDFCMKATAFISIYFAMHFFDK